MPLSRADRVVTRVPARRRKSSMRDSKCSRVGALFASKKRLNRPIRNGPRIAPRDLRLVIAEESCLLAAGAEIAFAKVAAGKPLVPTLASALTISSSLHAISCFPQRVHSQDATITCIPCRAECDAAIPSRDLGTRNQGVLPRFGFGHVDVEAAEMVVDSAASIVISGDCESALKIDLRARVGTGHHPSTARAPLRGHVERF